MAAKRVIQTYKPPGRWLGTPPGLGDFVRGACHLFEVLQPLGIELRLDVSRTGFAALIDQDLHGNRAGSFSAGRLMEFLTALGQDVEITVRPAQKEHGEMSVMIG